MPRGCNGGLLFFKKERVSDTHGSILFARSFSPCEQIWTKPTTQVSSQEQFRKLTLRWSLAVVLLTHSRFYSKHWRQYTLWDNNKLVSESPPSFRNDYGDSRLTISPSNILRSFVAPQRTSEFSSALRIK